MDMALIPVTAAAVTIVPLAWVANTWVRARHGYPLDDGKGSTVGPADLDAERKLALMASENERLTGQMLRLEERIAVLERIATDPATRIANEIERLR